MKTFEAGQYENFFWIEISSPVFDLADFLKSHADLLTDKYLAIVCFDGGPLSLVDEEKRLGWYEKDKVAYSPILSADTIANLPSEQHDQWCLFKTPTEFSGMTDYVNYRFTLAIQQYRIANADMTWDIVGIRRHVQFHEQLVEQFWQELTRINPAAFIAAGDSFIYVSKESNEIELLKKNAL